MTENKEDVIIFRLTEEDRSRIREKMNQFGIHNMSAYIRKMAIDGYCVNLDLDGVREMINLLSRCGNNLNQYAKRANQDGSIYLEDIRDLQNQFNEIRSTSKEILQSLTDIE